MALPAGQPSHGSQAGHALTFTPDHLVGAGQMPIQTKWPGLATHPPLSSSGMSRTLRPAS
jgi:hypothetical protein